MDCTTGIYDGTRYRFGVGGRGYFGICNVDTDGWYCSMGSFESDIFRHFPALVVHVFIDILLGVGVV